MHRVAWGPSARGAPGQLPTVTMCQDDNVNNHIRCIKLYVFNGCHGCQKYIYNLNKFGDSLQDTRFPHGKIPESCSKWRKFKLGGSHIRYTIYIYI